MNPTQAKIVNAAYALEESPNQQAIEELSAQTGLTVKWLKSWYQRTRTSKRKKKSVVSSTKTVKVSKFKSEFKDQVLPSENVKVNKSTPPLASPQELDSSAQQSFSPRPVTSSTPSKLQNHNVAPQPYIGRVPLRQDSLLEQSNNRIPLHISRNLYQYSRNNQTQVDPRNFPSVSTHFSQNEQHQFSQLYPEAPACEPVALESNCSIPYSSSGNYLFAPPNIPDRPEHMYRHYTVTGTGSLITPLPFTPDAQLSMYPDSKNVTWDGDNNEDLPHEAVTPTVLTHPLSDLDFSSLATQLPPSDYGSFIGNAGYNYTYNTSAVRLTPYNMNHLMYDDAAEKARDFVLRSLNEGLVDRDPFQAAMGLVVLSRLGLKWD